MDAVTLRSLIVVCLTSAHSVDSLVAYLTSQDIEVSPDAVRMELDILESHGRLIHNDNVYQLRIPALTFELVQACVELCPELCDSECVHVHADGNVSTGTDGETTFPACAYDWRDVVYTFRPDRAPDYFDCFCWAESGERVE